MDIFDIMGPVMVGPSSSHTAGAVKIGHVARELLNEEKIKAFITEDKLKELLDVPNKAIHRRVIKAFPGMKSKKYPDAIKQFKREINEFKNKKNS